MDVVYPSLFYDGTEYPDVPAGAAVFVTPLWGNSSGGAGNITLRGNDGLFANVGSFDAFQRRAKFSGTEVVRVRVLGFAVAFCTVVSNFGAALGAGTGPQLHVYRDDLDDTGAVRASAAADLVLADALSQPRPIIGCGPEGPQRIDPLLPGDTDGLGMILTDHRVRFRVEVGQVGAFPVINTPILGRLAVAMWPVPKAGAESLRMAG